MATTIPERGLVILDFTAEHCAPCRQLAKVLERVATDYAGRLDVLEVDVGADFDLARRFDVRATPTLVLWRDGREVGRAIGARPLAFVAGMVDRALAGDVSIASP